MPGTFFEYTNYPKNNSDKDSKSDKDNDKNSTISNIKTLWIAGGRIPDVPDMVFADCS